MIAESQPDTSEVGQIVRYDRAHGAVGTAGGHQDSVKRVRFPSAPQSNRIVALEKHEISGLYSCAKDSRRAMMLETVAVVFAQAWSGASPSLES